MAECSLMLEKTEIHHLRTSHVIRPRSFCEKTIPFFSVCVTHACYTTLNSVCRSFVISIANPRERVLGPAFLLFSHSRLKLSSYPHSHNTPNLILPSAASYAIRDLDSCTLSKSLQLPFATQTSFPQAISKKKGFLSPKLPQVQSPNKAVPRAKQPLQLGTSHDNSCSQSLTHFVFHECSCPMSYSIHCSIELKIIRTNHRLFLVQLDPFTVESIASGIMHKSNPSELSELVVSFVPLTSNTQNHPRRHTAAKRDTSWSNLITVLPEK